MKYTWVIGGTSGIGKATAELLDEDADRNVFATGIHGADVREPLEIERAWSMFCYNLSSDDSVEIVYCAGINELARIGDIENDMLVDLFDVNVFGFVRLINFLREERVDNIRIVAVSSDAATRPLRTSLAYCSSKAALDMAVRVAARELAMHGWRVNAVAPGMTADTNMTKYIDKTVPPLRGWTPEEAYSYEMQQAVIKRRATPREVASVIEMVLNGPDYLNGEIITINGGR